MGACRVHRRRRRARRVCAARRDAPRRPRAPAHRPSRPPSAVRGARQARARSRRIRPRRSSRTSSRARTITFWTFYLSPTFDQYIKDTIARFQATYPGVTVNWEDHQATFKDDLNNAFAAGNAPDVINLSVSEGWVSEYAAKGLLLPLDDKVPQTVKDIYFPGLWKEQLINGVNYQFPWYQGLNVELINKRHLSTRAGLTVDHFPKTIDGPAGPVQDDPRQDRRPCATSA